MDHFYSIYCIVSVFCFCFFGHKPCGILTPWSDIEPTPPALEGEVLTSGLPWKFPKNVFFIFKAWDWLFYWVKETWMALNMH